MVKPLLFKGEKPRKRKREEDVTALNRDTSSQAKERLDGHVADEHAEDHRWITTERLEDISGPVIIVHPSKRPCSLACDTEGSVFSLELQNMLHDAEEQPDPSTAEPHDVRGVWIAQRIVGTSTISLKGYHHKYLRCDAQGMLRADQDAISAECQFRPIVAEEGLWAIASEHEKFVRFGKPKLGKDPTVHGDGQSVDHESAVWIRGQSKFRHRPEEQEVARRETRITRRELQAKVGRTLDEAETKTLKRAWKDGTFNQAVLDIRTKGKHDKFAPS